MENELELEDSQTPQEEVAADDNIGEDETPEKDVKLEEANKKLFARAKKAEMELKALKEKVPPPQPEKPKDDVEKLIDQKVEEKLGEKDLNSLEVSEETKENIKNYAKANGLSIQKALKSEFFSFLKEKEENAKKVEEASIGGKRGALTSKDYSKVSPKDFDLTTEEGRKDYEGYKTYLKQK